MVIGWIDDLFFAVLDIEDKDKKRVIGACENTDISDILVRAEDLKTLDFLPKEIKLTDIKAKRE